MSKREDRRAAKKNKKTNTLPDLTSRDKGFQVIYHHAPGKNKDGVEVNGRLVAATAIQEVEDGKIAVAISRCNPIDQPTRHGGRSRATARLNRFLNLRAGSKMTDDQKTNAAVDIRRNQALVMTKEEFNEKIVKGKPFLREDCPYGREDKNIVVEIPE